MKRALRIVALLFLVLLLAIAGGVAWLQTAPGKAFLAAEISRRGSTPEQRISISDITGSLPFDFRVGQFTIADTDGVWLAVTDFRLHVSPLALFGRRLHIEEVSAATVDMARSPLSSPASEKKSKDSFPTLPFRIELDRLTVPHIGLGAALAGQPVTLAADAHANATNKTADLVLNVARIDGQPGEAKLQLSYTLASNSIKLAADISEPSGVMADDLLKRQDHLPLNAVLTGEGPLSGWHGGLAIHAGTLAKIESTIDLGIKAKQQRYDADISLSDNGVLPENMRALAQPAQLKISATNDDGAWTIPTLSLESPLGALSGSAHYDTATGDLQSSLKFQSTDLSILQAFAGRSLSGMLSVQADLSGSIDEPKFTISGGLKDVKTAGLPDDLGHEIAFAMAGGAARGGSKVTLDKVTITGTGTDIEASGSKSGEDMQAHIGAKLADLSRFSALAGKRLGGSTEIIADIRDTSNDISGTLSANGKALVFDTVTLDRLQIEAKLPSLAAKKGDLTLQFARADLAGSFSAGISRPDDNTLDLSDIILKTNDTRLTGDLALNTTSTTAHGKIALSVPTLGIWSALAGTPLAGSANATILLSDRQGQSLDAEIHAAALTFGTSGLATLDATAKLANVTVQPIGQVQLTAGGLHAGSAVLDKTTAAFASVKPGSWRFNLDTAGTATKPVSLSLSGTIDQAADTIKLTLANLAGKYGRIPVQLRAPFTATKRGDDFATGKLALGVGAGTVAGTASLTQTSVDAHLAASDFSLAEFGPAFGQQTMGGRMQASLALTGSPASPNGTVKLTLTDLNYDTTSPQAASNLFAASFAATLQGGGISLNGTVSARQGLAIKIAGHIPAELSLRPFAASFSDNAPLSLDITGNGNLTDLAGSLPIGEDQVAGTLTVDAHVHGALAEPIYAGHVLIGNGSYHNQALGTVLKNMAVDIAGNSQRITVRSLKADDGAGGTLSASGDVMLASGSPHTIAITGKIGSFLIAQRSEATVKVDGNLEVTGTMNAPLVRIRATVPRADLSIPDSMPASVPTLNVVRINSAHPRRKATGGDTPPLFIIGLDVAVDIPGQFFLRGRGLDSTWAGNVTVTGTSAAPSIKGQLRTVYGNLSALGKDFSLTRGIIVFDGGTSIDPRLDVEATASASGITARIDVTGTASQPKIALNSDPPMPQDEILSHVLFGENASQISPAEGLQLAQAVASLSGGGGFDVFDTLRQSTGLDRLGLTSTTGSSTTQNQSALSGTAVSGGKYVANGVFVGVQQGLTAGSSAAKVEVEVAPNVTVNGTVGEDSSTGLGVTYTLDY